MSDITTTGATGAIGRRAVAQLLAAGHHVRGVTRSPQGRALLEGLGAEAVEADVFDPADLARAFAGSDVVVNLLTRIPPVAQMAEPGAWEANDRLRREASGAVARAAQAAGARRLVQESFAHLHADGGARLLDEDAPLEADPLTASSLDAERNAQRLFAGDTVVLRFGSLVAPDADGTRAQLAAARAGASPVPAPPGAYVPTVWIDDAAAAVVAALEVPAGTYLVVDDVPATVEEVEAALAAAVGRTALLRPAPGGAAGAMGRSLRLSNRRLRAASSWAPRVRGGVEGWRLAAEEPVAA